jgi:hypothetical protein
VWRKVEDVSEFRAKALKKAVGEEDSKIDEWCRELAVRLLDGKYLNYNKKRYA